MNPYATDAAFRVALEQRLLNLARSTSVNLERLRRQVVLERLLARLVAAEPHLWVLKGAMALEVRLATAARATSDVDLGMRAGAVASDIEVLADTLAQALTIPAGDPFVYQLADVEPTSASSRDLARACSHQSPSRG